MAANPFAPQGAAAAPAANPFGATAAPAANPFGAATTTAANPFGTAAPAAPATNVFGGTAPAANPFGATTTTTAAASPFGAATTAAANPFGAATTTAANPFGTTAAPATSAVAASAAAPAAAGGHGRVIPTKPYGHFRWFEDPPRPLPAPAPAPVYGAAPAPAPAPAVVAPPDVEREYASLRVAYSNRPLYQGQVAPSPVRQQAAAGFGAAATTVLATSRTGEYLDAPFIHTVYERARADREYAPPQVLKLRADGTAAVPSERIPLVDPTRMRVVRRRLDRRLRFDAEEEDERERLRAEPARPTVIVGFNGVAEYTDRLKAEAAQYHVHASGGQRDAAALVMELRRLATEVMTLEERQRRITRRCLDASQAVLEDVLGSQHGGLQDAERALMRRITAVQDRATGPAGLLRRAEAVITQAAVDGEDDGGPSEEGGGQDLGQFALEAIARVLKSHHESIGRLKGQVRDAAEDLGLVVRQLSA